MVDEIVVTRGLCCRAQRSWYGVHTTTSRASRVISGIFPRLRTQRMNGFAGELCARWTMSSRS